MKNLDTHKFEDKDFGRRMSWLNTSIGITGKVIPAFGFD
jgi:hypothetical protein